MNKTILQNRGGALLTFFMVPLAIAVVSILVAAGGETVTAWLRYDREGILNGELWRVFTAHLVHLGWNHLLMNLAGLFLIWALFGRMLSNRAWIAVLLLAAVAITLGLLFFNPLIRWYVGLSGVLHGMFLTGALLSIYAGYRAEILLLVFIIAKLAWEQHNGPLPGSAAMAGGNVLVDAHLYGAIAGVLAAMFFIARQGLKKDRGLGNY